MKKYCCDICGQEINDNNYDFRIMGYGDICLNCRIAMEAEKRNQYMQAQEYNRKQAIERINNDPVSSD